jgi:14-3-3 protein epsilon
MQLCENTESRVFFYKMIGDYYRYAAESCMHPSNDFKSQCDKFVESSKVFYLEGVKMAASDLDPCNPIRLSTVLNLSVFYKEISGELPKAILLTEHALQNAVEKIDDLGFTPFKDTQTLIEIMNNNLSIWKAELE